MGRRRTTSCLDHRGANCAECARQRARRHRRAAPARVRSADRRRRDGRRVQEERARGYVGSYERRGKLWGPARCDRCFLDRPLRWWHPDPAQVRQLAWLCSSCLSVVRSSREDLTLTWVWPGVAPPAPVVRSFVLEPAWIVAAAAAVPVGGTDRVRAQAWVAGFFAAAGQRERDDLLASVDAGLASWAPYGDRVVDATLRWWVQGEKAARRRQRGLEQLEAEGRVVVPVAARERRTRRGTVVAPRGAGGFVSGPAAGPVAAPRGVVAKLDDALLERVDAALASADDFNARFAERLRAFEARRVVVADDVDDED